MIDPGEPRTFDLVIITDLHIANHPNHGYTPYDYGIADDLFVKNPEGSILREKSGRATAYSPISLRRGARLVGQSISVFVPTVSPVSGTT